MRTLSDLPAELIELVALNVYDPLEVTEESLLLGTSILAPPDPRKIRALRSFGHICRATERAIHPLLYRNHHVGDYIALTRAVEPTWRWRHHVKILHLDLDLPRRVPDEETWLAFTAGVVHRLLTSLPFVAHLRVRLTTTDAHRILAAVAERLPQTPDGGLCARLRSLAFDCKEDLRGRGPAGGGSSGGGAGDDTEQDELPALPPFVQCFPCLEFFAISAEYAGRAPPVVPMLESIASPLAALTVNGFFREHCVPLVGTIATRFPLLESLIIRGCDRMLQEMIFRTHAAPALREFQRLQVFKVSCPGFNGDQFRSMVVRVAPLLPTLLVMGLEDEDNTWGIWRDGQVAVKHLEPGDLRRLQN